MLILRGTQHYFMENKYVLGRVLERPFDLDKSKEVTLSRVRYATLKHGSEVNQIL